jgi:hypothetical protein
MNESGRKWDRNQTPRHSTAPDKRLCVVMMNGFELIGDLCDSGRLERPFLLQRQGVNLALVDMMKIGVLSGDSIMLNMEAHLWIGEPSEAIAKIYRAQRSGLILDNAAVNQ